MIKTNFPKARFADENDLQDQFNHLMTEVEEVKAAFNDPEQGMIRMLEELADLHHSLETFWHIAEKEFGPYVIGSVFTGTVFKNRSRNYYLDEE
jgi:hypothetical protein